ncbi:SusC/RagA family TonB-linked outer membrane protein [Pedobacter sp. AW31-3R]|uniref:SusC/RagA family TonB-linked outer membrane protein n=1 Tax=Pedobacter sp. AW31-3R TaxID=3445781 RepID=UPI003FA18ABD
MTNNSKVKLTFARVSLRIILGSLLLCSVLPAFSQVPNAPLINSRLLGVVMDSRSKETLPGATVQIEGTTHSVLTDANGKFSFITGQKFPYTLIVSYIGYKTKTQIAATGTVEVQLEEVLNQLNDVVVVGYGTQKRSDVTGSISSVNERLLKQPVSSFDQALKGAAPGVQVTQTSGQPGGGVSIRIRGGSSIQGGNEPLYVIDGFPVYNVANSAGVLSGVSPNPLGNINPADIESIDILKDASATAIYGSRGANGVVIVTTKKGKNGGTVTYEGSYGVQSIRKTIAVLNATEFANLRNEALLDKTPALGANQYLSADAISRLGEGTDWQNEAFRSAGMQNHQLSITGGGEKTHYAISGNYFDQDGIITNTGFKRYATRVNVESHPYDRLKVGLNLSGSRTSANVSPSGVVSALLNMPATASVYDSNGSYTLRNPFENIISNPIASLNAQQNETSAYRILGTAFAEYRIIDGLKLKVLAGTDVNNTKENSYIPSTVYEGNAKKGIAAIGTLNSYSWLNENTLSYDKTFGKDHNFSSVIGFTQQAFHAESVTAGSSNFVSDDLAYHNLASGSVLTTPTSNTAEWALNSYLARVNYSYKQKYYVTASVRADGSSRFGKNNKWGYFPSAALAWKVSNEDFFTPLAAVVSDFKLRTSFGATGNQEIGNYQSLSTLSSVKYLFGNTLVTGFTPTNIANDDLGWETTYQYDGGFDIGFLKDRITLSADVYYKKTTDLLLSVEIPWTSGQSTSLQNFGSVSNKGLEIGIRSRNLTGALTWDTDLNISFNRNKVLSIGDGSTDYYLSGSYIVQVGQPLGSFYGSVTDGVLQTADIASKGALTGKTTPKAGDRLYKDIDGNGTFSNASDREIIGNAQPDFIFGINNTFSWKRFDLGVFIQGSYGNQILNSNLQTLELFTGQQNAASSALDRWTPENTNTDVPRASSDPANFFSSRFVEDGSFLRLKSVTLGYNLPKSVISALKIRNARIFFSGQNLLTWTNYTGFDPEVTSGSNVSPGTDSGIYPISRSITGGLSVTF